MKKTFLEYKRLIGFGRFFRFGVGWVVLLEVLDLSGDLECMGLE